MSANDRGSEVKMRQVSGYEQFFQPSGHAESHLATVSPMAATQPTSLITAAFRMVGLSKSSLMPKTEVTFHGHSSMVLV